MTAPGEVRFDDRVTVVTGAARGLGLAYARYIAGRGGAVVVNDVDSELAEAAVAELRSEGARAAASAADVSTADGAAALVATAVAEFGSLDAVVNNAGVIRRQTVDELTEEAIDLTLRVNLRGAMLVTRAAWPHLRASGSGRVVCATSASGLLENKNAATYGTTKAGLVGLVRVLAAEGADDGIRANAISPLAITRMTESLGLAGWNEKTMGTDLVAPVVAWLAHPDCPLTGEVLSAGGGRVGLYFTGLTQGFHDDRLTAESVRDNLERILDRDGAIVPRTPADEFELLRNL